MITKKTTNMKVLTLRLPDDLLHEIEDNTNALKTKRADYIRAALHTYNAKIKKKRLKQKLIAASPKVRT